MLRVLWLEQLADGQPPPAAPLGNGMAATRGAGRCPPPRPPQAPRSAGTWTRTRHLRPAKGPIRAPKQKGPQVPDWDMDYGWALPPQASSVPLGREAPDRRHPVADAAETWVPLGGLLNHFRETVLPSFSRVAWGPTPFGSGVTQNDAYGFCDQGFTFEAKPWC